MDPTEKDPFADYGSMDITFLGFEPVLFPTFELKTRKILFNILIYIMSFPAFFPDFFQELLHQVAVFSNVIQFIVLTRGSMRVNSINVVLSTMSLNQICITLHHFWIENYGKTTLMATKRRNPYMVDIEIGSFRNSLVESFFRRNSFWLPIVLAFTRAIVIYNLKKSKYQYLATGKFGLLASIFVIGISGLFGFCTFFTMTSSGLSPSKEYYQIWKKYCDIYDAVSVVLQYFIPPSFCIILVIILIIKLPSANSFALLTNRRDYATKMIISMVVLFLFSAIPHAIGGIMCLFYGPNKGFDYMGNAIYSITAYIHLFIGSFNCLICATMTPNYKNTFLDIFRIRNKYSQSAVAAASGVEPTN